MDTELRYYYTLIKSVYDLISLSEPHYLHISNSKISTLPQIVGVLKCPEEYPLIYQTPPCY